MGEQQVSDFLNTQKILHIPLQDGEDHHMRKVLRLKDGDFVELCDGLGHVYTVQIVHNASDKNRGFLLKNYKFFKPQNPGLILCLACPKPAAFEALLTPMCQLGVQQVWVFPSRCSPSFSKGVYEKQDRWQRVLKAELGLSKRPWLPKLVFFKSFEEMFEDPSQKDMMKISQIPWALCDEIFLHPAGEADQPLGFLQWLQGLSHLLAKETGSSDSHVGVVIGAEAGLDREEKEAFKTQLGARTVALGQGILSVPGAVWCVASVFEAWRVACHGTGRCFSPP